VSLKEFAKKGVFLRNKFYGPTVLFISVVQLHDILKFLAVYSVATETYVFFARKKERKIKKKHYVVENPLFWFIK
jgi:hypothetical protein